MSGTKVKEAVELKPTPIRKGHWRNRWHIKRPRMWSLIGLFDAEDVREGDFVTCHRKHESEAVAERVARRELKSVGIVRRQLISYRGPVFFPEKSPP